MRKMKETERAQILEYVMAEPEINLFFIGDIENYGIDSDEINVYVQEEGEAWDSLVLRYFDNYIIYSQKDTFRIEPVIAFLKDKIIDSMNGKASILRRIAPFFPKMRLDIEYMLRCNHVEKNMITVEDAKLRLLTAEDAEEIVDLYITVEETTLRFEETRSKKIAERRANLERDGFAMGMFYQDQLVSVAEISADSARSGMIIGVATHPDFRGRGYSSKTTSALCEEAFKRGKEFLCVFYDNPDAGRLYKKIGFEEVDKYALMY